MEIWIYFCAGSKHQQHCLLEARVYTPTTTQDRQWMRRVNSKSGPSNARTQLRLRAKGTNPQIKQN